MNEFFFNEDFNTFLPSLPLFPCPYNILLLLSTIFFFMSIYIFSGNIFNQFFLNCMFPMNMIVHLSLTFPIFVCTIVNVCFMPFLIQVMREGERENGIKEADLKMQKASLFIPIFPSFHSFRTLCVILLLFFFSSFKSSLFCRQWEGETENEIHIYVYKKCLNSCFVCPLPSFTLSHLSLSLSFFSSLYSYYYYYFQSIQHTHKLEDREKGEEGMRRKYSPKEGRREWLSILNPFIGPLFFCPFFCILYSLSKRELFSSLFTFINCSLTILIHCISLLWLSFIPSSSSSLSLSHFSLLSKCYTFPLHFIPSPLSSHIHTHNTDDPFICTTCPFVIHTFPEYPSSSPPPPLCKHKLKRSVFRWMEWNMEKDTWKEKRESFNGWIWRRCEKKNSFQMYNIRYHSRQTMDMDCPFIHSSLPLNSHSFTTLGRTARHENGKDVRNRNSKKIIFLVTLKLQSQELLHQFLVNGLPRDGRRGSMNSRSDVSYTMRYALCVCCFK